MSKISKLQDNLNEVGATLDYAHAQLEKGDVRQVMEAAKDLGRIAGAIQVNAFQHLDELKERA